MITDRDIYRGVSVLRRFGASRVVLFGSARSDPANARDLDLGCNGLAPQYFFDAVAELNGLTGPSVDLVDLDLDNGIARHVRRYGEVIYMSDGEFAGVIRNELASVEKSVAYIRARPIERDDDDRRLGVALSLHSIYGGVENVMVRFARFHAVELPSGEGWQKTLLNWFAEPGRPPLPVLIAVDAAPYLRRLRDFRHVVRANYAVDIEVDRMMPNVEDLDRWLPSWRGAVLRALQDRLPH